MISQRIFFMRLYDKPLLSGFGWIMISDQRRPLLIIERVASRTLRLIAFLATARLSTLRDTITRARGVLDCSRDNQIAKNSFSARRPPRNTVLMSRAPRRRCWRESIFTARSACGPCACAAKARCAHPSYASGAENRASVCVFVFWADM